MIHHSSSPDTYSSSQPGGISPGHTSLPEKQQHSKAEYTNTQQGLPDKITLNLDMQGFLAGGFVLPKATKS